MIAVDPGIQSELTVLHHDVGLPDTSHCAKLHTQLRHDHSSNLEITLNCVKLSYGGRT